MTFLGLTLFSVNVNAKGQQVSSSKLLNNAISLRQSGQHHQAVEILDQLKNEYQDHKRVNVELVINYINLKQFPQAQSSIDHLYSLPLSEQERKKLISLQKLVKKSTLQLANKHFFSMELLASYGVDSLTSQFPVYEYLDFSDMEDYEYQDFGDMEDYEYQDFGDMGEYEYQDLGEQEEYIEVDDIDLVGDRDEAKDKHENSYTSERLRAIYRYRPGTQFDFFGQQASLLWYNNFTLNQKQVNDEYDSRYTQIKFDSTLYLLQSNRWIFDARLRSRYHAADGFKMLNDQSIQFSASMPLDKARIKVGLELSNRSFADYNRDNDASVSTPWLEYTVNLSEDFRWSVGSRYRKNHARDPFYSYDNLNFYTSLYYNHTQNFSVSITLNRNRLHYLIDDPELVYWAIERKHSAAIGIKYQVNQNLSLGFNSHFVTNKQEHGFGEDEWNRLEFFVGYLF